MKQKKREREQDEGMKFNPGDKLVMKRGADKQEVQVRSACMYMEQM